MSYHYSSPLWMVQLYVTLSHVAVCREGCGLEPGGWTSNVCVYLEQSCRVGLVVGILSKRNPLIGVAI